MCASAARSSAIAAETIRRGRSGVHAQSRPLAHQARRRASAKFGTASVAPAATSSPSSSDVESPTTASPAAAASGHARAGSPRKRTSAAGVRPESARGPSDRASGCGLACSISSPITMTSKRRARPRASSISRALARGASGHDAAGELRPLGGREQPAQARPGLRAGRPSDRNPGFLGVGEARPLRLRHVGEDVAHDRRVLPAR